MRRGAAIVLSWLLSATYAATPPHVVRWRDAVDWEAAGDEAVDVLSEYLQVDTTNPPGNEDRGVEFLAGWLDEQGIGWTRLTLAPGRSSLVARIPGDGTGGGPLCLMHHIDVASHQVESWPAGTGPLSGAVDGGFVWGRGAMDMKSMGVFELLTAAWLTRLDVPLSRDVVLLAVADEEVHNGGAMQLAGPAWDVAGCELLINEGGLGVSDALFEGQAVHAISVAEKGVLWVRMIASGRAGHGSTPYGDEAPGRLLDAMTAVDARHRPDWHIDPAVHDLLAASGAHRGGLTGAILQSRWLTRTLAMGQLRANPVMAAVLHDTVHLTGMGGAESPNVVPGEVWAQYDCRLLPQTSPAEHMAYLEHLVRDVPGIRFEVLHAHGSNRSPTDDPLYRALAHYATEDRPHAVAGPLLSVGFTDSLLLRPRGVRAYGYVPVEVSAEVAATMHATGERIPIDQVGEGLRRLFSVVVDQAVAP